MTAKVSAEPQSPRSVLNVFVYLLSQPFNSPASSGQRPNPESYFLSEGSYQSERTLLLQTESIVLRCIGFEIKVVTPHHLTLTYLQTLGVLPATPTSQSTALAARSLAHLNTALLSSQLLYITHQPCSLAVAAIYLAAREIGVKLPCSEWWEVFDVDREELGFLVVGLKSCTGFAELEDAKWTEQSCPLTVEDLEYMLSQRDIDSSA